MYIQTLLVVAINKVIKVDIMNLSISYIQNIIGELLMFFIVEQLRDCWIKLLPQIHLLDFDVISSYKTQATHCGIEKPIWLLCCGKNQLIHCYEDKIMKCWG